MLVLLFKEGWHKVTRGGEAARSAGREEASCFEGGGSSAKENLAAVEESGEGGRICGGEHRNGGTLGRPEGWRSVKVKRGGKPITGSSGREKRE